jgi:hypothetical protein
VRGMRLENRKVGQEEVGWKSRFAPHAVPTSKRRVWCIQELQARNTIWRSARVAPETGPASTYLVTVAVYPSQDTPNSTTSNTPPKPEEEKEQHTKEKCHHIVTGRSTDNSCKDIIPKSHNQQSHSYQHPATSSSKTPKTLLPVPRPRRPPHLPLLALVPQILPIARMKQCAYAAEERVALSR